MSKHTPGPWFVNDNPLKMSEYCILAESRGTAFGASVAIANQREGRNPLSPEEAKANAQIMSAAPELLEALKIVTNDLACLVENAGKQAALDPRIKKARAAMAKAEGEEK